jgi:hypothetical protein
MTFTTKYNPDDKVYFMSQNKMKDGTIQKIVRIETIDQGSGYTTHYMLLNGSVIAEELLFSSKIDIISHLTGVDL